jgi:fumarate hydratase class I
MNRAAMADFTYQDILPIGHDDTPYRLLTKDHVSTFEAGGATFLRVEPEALTLLTREAMRDIAHLLRSGHLRQLASILKDPEASSNDRIVALELLRTPASPPATCCRAARTPAPRS